MPISYKCPFCGNVVTTQSEVASIKCPYCQNEFEGAGNRQPPQFQGGAQGQQQYAYQQPNQQQPNQQPYGYYPPQQSNDIFSEGPSGKSRGIAGLLAIFLGALGVHYFYLGKSTPGVVFLVVTLLSCGILGAVTGIVALVQGIMMMCMSQQDFENKYVNPANSFPLF